MSFLRPVFTGCAGIFLLTAAAFGQNQAPAQPPAPVSSQPETTTASFGAWTLRCQLRHEPTVDTRICEVENGIVPQGQQNPIAHIVVNRPSPKEELLVTAVVPISVIFPSVPKISAGDKEPGLELAWKRCVPIGCMAVNVLKDDILRAWRAETGENTGRLVFTDATGRPVNIQFTFRGFAQAMDAFAKEK